MVTTIKIMIQYYVKSSMFRKDNRLTKKVISSKLGIHNSLETSEDFFPQAVSFKIWFITLALCKDKLT